MAKVMSSLSVLGTTPPSESLDWSQLISTDFFEHDLFGELNDYHVSIEAEINKMNDLDNCNDVYINGGTNSDCNSSSNNGCLDNDSKVLRNKNCMWSGTTMSMQMSAANTNLNTNLSTSASSSSSVSDNGASMPLAVVTGGGVVSLKHQQQQSATTQPPPVVVVASKKLRNNYHKSLLQQQQEQNFSLHTTIKVEPVDNDYEQQLQQHNIPTSKTLLKETAAQLQNLKHIPAGTSLLRKSNTQQQQQQQRKSTNSRSSSAATTIKISTAEFISARDQLLTTAATHQQNALMNSNNKSTISNAARNNASYYGRPDTPHSLDDEAALMYPTVSNDGVTTTNTTTGFSHNVDLGACIMGSNNISLQATIINDPIHHIDQLSKQLQDMSKDHIDLPVLGNNQLDDVLELINDDSSRGGGGTSIHTTHHQQQIVSKMTKSMHNLRTSDYDSDDCDDVSLNGSSCDSLLSSHINEDSMCSKIVDASMYGISLSPATSPISSCSSSSSKSSSPKYRQQQQQQQQIMQSQSYLHSDHSYTRCKDGMEDINSLETPSDSDEEIDVVSIGDKKLPTNPSDKDRRAIQTKFAHKISNSRVVKNPNGIRTIPPRRRGSFELPYTPASSSPVKSVANSRYPSPASTPYHNQQSSNSSNTTMLIVNNNLSNSNCITIEKSRKRINGILHTNNANNSMDNDYALPPMKKCRNKKQQQQQQVVTAVNNNAAAAAALKRHYSFDETADTIEKRNLHNDMERQRRIGLKNLFDALKKQIPSIKDKERAPKVNILREAAKLCEALTREDEQLNEQRALLREQFRMRQELLANLRNLKQE